MGECHESVGVDPPVVVDDDAAARRDAKGSACHEVLLWSLADRPTASGRAVALVGAGVAERATSRSPAEHHRPTIRPVILPATSWTGTGHPAVPARRSPAGPNAGDDLVGPEGVEEKWPCAGSVLISRTTSAPDATAIVPSTCRSGPTWATARTPSSVTSRSRWCRASIRAATSRSPTPRTMCLRAAGDQVPAVVRRTPGPRRRSGSRALRRHRSPPHHDLVRNAWGRPRRRQVRAGQLLGGARRGR